MGRSKLCDAVADAVVAEGVEVAFGLMGNGNMFVMDAIGRRARVVHARHEHAAVTMADGYARHTGRVGLALTTGGPGFTQIATALTVAARAETPLVVLVGDAPQRLPFRIHTMDQAPLAAATGSVYVAVRAAERLHFDLARAFHTARTRRIPVVVGIPEDMQTVPVDGDYVPSRRTAVAPQRPQPDPASLDALAEWLAAAERPVVLAGAGAARAGAGPDLARLALRCGALLATTLLGKGLFDGEPFDVGVAGGLSTPLARELLSEADLVLAFGARLGHYTTDGGTLFPRARVAQVSLTLDGLHEGVKTADLHVLADAGATARALAARLPAERDGWRRPALGRRLDAEVADPAVYPVPAGTIDPRAALARIDAIVPKDWEVVVGLGHYFFFAMAHLSGRAPERYHVISEFGAIGSALSAAIGVAAARRDGGVLLIDGDGSMMMHVQEIETVRRSGIRLLMAVLNDGAYGAELHGMRAHGLDPAASIHGACDFAAVAAAFGVDGATVVDVDAMEPLLRRYEGSGAAALWDIRIADTVPAIPYRR